MALMRPGAIGRAPLKPAMPHMSPSEIAAIIRTVSDMPQIERLLVIRRDNIGDLVCTTPLIAALRKRFPQAWLGALVNSYNAPVLESNPDLDEVIAYRKLKHLEPGESAAAALGERIASTWRLRRMRLDCVILATPDFVARTARLARWLGPKKVLGFSDGSAAARRLDLSVPLSKVSGRHEVERVFALGGHLGITGEIPPLRVVADPAEVAKATAAFDAHRGLKVALHISARRPGQRWPAERFAALIERLHAEHGAVSMLLWSPGPADHPQHPGDDDKAAQIAQRVAGRTPLVSYRTDRLRELIGALAAADIVVCSDGGALHLSAGLRKPIVCLFGDSPPERWGPWGVPHRVVLAPSRNVLSTSVDQVFGAFADLLRSPQEPAGLSSCVV
jgi:ADP-heptose:LPS heptosyltransferase